MPGKLFVLFALGGAGIGVIAVFVIEWRKEPDRRLSWTELLVRLGEAVLLGGVLGAALFMLLKANRVL